MMLKDLKAFLLRGNVVDLAVGVVIGAAFGAVVAGFVKDLLTPLIGAIVGKASFADLEFVINGSHFKYGEFINLLIGFVLVGTAVFYFVVVPINALVARSRREPAAEPDTQKCPECLSVVPLQARRCAYCTSPITA